jgi:hypothetical protein
MSPASHGIDTRALHQGEAKRYNLVTTKIILTKIASDMRLDPQDRRSLFAAHMLQNHFAARA